MRRAARPLRVQELAEAVGLGPNTVRQHLDQLVEARLVEREPGDPRGRGRPAYRYVALPAPDDEDPAPYRALAGVLAGQLARRPDGDLGAQAAGERWGRRMALEAADRAPGSSWRDGLVEILGEAGFAPEAPADEDDPILLRHCPFGTLAHDHREVVCGVHLGLIRGALHELGAPFGAANLEPHAEPDLCLVRLERRSGA